MQKGGLAHTLEVKPLPSYMPHLHFIGGTRKVKKSALPAMQEEKEKKPKPMDAQWEEIIAEIHKGDENRRLFDGKHSGVKNEFSYRSVFQKWSQICQVSIESIRRRVCKGVLICNPVGRPKSFTDANAAILENEVAKAQISSTGFMTFDSATALMGRLAVEAGVPYPDGVPTNETAMTALRSIPNMHTAEGIQTTAARLEATADHKTISGFFKAVEKIYDTHPMLKNYPMCHGNFDESGFDLKMDGNQICFWVSNRRQSFWKARVACVTSGSTHVSLGAFHTADGYTPPNSYTVAGGNVQSSWFSPHLDKNHPYLQPCTRETMLNLYLSTSESGMLDGVLYGNIMINHHLPLWREYMTSCGVPPEVPGVLYVDFPESHRPTPEWLVALDKYNIILCTLPHNSSTLLQWLDLKWFKLLKKWVRKFFQMLQSVRADKRNYIALHKKGVYKLFQATDVEWDNWPAEKRTERSRCLGLDCRLSARTIIQVSEYVCLKYLTKEDAIEASRISGIFPFNPDIILSKIEGRKNTTPADIRQSIRNLEKGVCDSIQKALNLEQNSYAYKIECIKQILVDSPDSRSMMTKSKHFYLN
jgi:hypothetical protein